MKVLLAEDELTLRNTFSKMLVRLGHEVDAFATGAGLCDALDRGAQPDLVWTDLAMPEVDGLTVIRRARRLLPNVQILVVSGHSDVEHVLWALREDADHFLSKPVEMSEFHAVLRRINDICAAGRDKVRSWHSFVRCDLELHVPASYGVAAATAALFAKHACAFLDEPGCRGLQIAVHEVLLNSIEHGCLEITREEKLTALTENRYSDLIAARSADPRLGTRFVHVRMTADVERGIEISLTDPGPGFDPATLPDPSDDSFLELPSGRGTFMARLHVDELVYANGGRTAILRARRHATPSQPPSGKLSEPPGGKLSEPPGGRPSEPAPQDEGA
jgi:CheY-like chemotaxis protein/anti-sigma regulatory factor (Ser/Thr protein kinase)